MKHLDCCIFVNMPLLSFTVENEKREKKRGPQLSYLILENRKCITDAS